MNPQIGFCLYWIAMNLHCIKIQGQMKQMFSPVIIGFHVQIHNLIGHMDLDLICMNLMQRWNILRLVIL